MEKKLNCSTLFGMEISPNCYFQPNWETSSIDPNDPFESALSSMVSSPTGGSNGEDVIPGDGMMIRELIGRLGSICGSPESCIATGNNSTNTSCYSTPLNSPPKRFNLSSLVPIPMQNNDSNFPNHASNLASLNADPGFVERAAQFSCFGNNNFVGGEMGMNYNVNRSVHNLESGKLSGVSSSLSMKKFGGISRDSAPENGELGDSRERSSVSPNDANSKKRKSISKTSVKDSPTSAPTNDKVDAEKEESNAKRSKTEDEVAKKENAGDSKNITNTKHNNIKEKQTNNNNNSNNNNDSNDNKEAPTPKPEPPKDYIHVRARRGQATDSHSLAERVRREKISERMKFLQDLVPGCNKVTGKATVLDEIINYVQSLQRQVEFLSMKLATVNPRMEFNGDALLSKDMFSSGGSTLSQTMYPLDQNSAQAFPLGYHQSSERMPIPSFTNGLPNGAENPFSLNPLSAAGIRRNPNPSLHLPSIDGYGDSMTQLSSFWEDDLHSIVQMCTAQSNAKHTR